MVRITDIYFIIYLFTYFGTWLRIVLHKYTELFFVNYNLATNNKAISFPKTVTKCLVVQVGGKIQNEQVRIDPM